jgi:ribonuclease HI
MARLCSFAYFLLKCVSIVKDGIIILNPIFMANIFIYLYDNQYYHSFILFFKRILFVFVLFLVIIGNISYGFIRKKQITVRVSSPLQCKNESMDIIEQEQKVSIISPISEISTSNQINDSCELPLEVSLKEFPPNVKTSTESSRQLICYCDGSYSYKSRIGYSGFLASNGYSKYRFCPLRKRRSGSTETEVFAACLALQYTAKYNYDTLIIYTDNTKVEQLLKRPKEKDYNDYPKFFEAHKQCYEGNDQFHLRVEHARGHTTWYEQQQCSTKREFAMVDRQVRRKRQRHEYKYNFINKVSDPTHITYCYRCDGRYVRLIHPEQFGATFIITSSC